MRNGPWSDIECFLAIWIYYQLEKDPSTVKSHLYRKVADIIGRSPGAVEYKVTNVSACDERPREEKPISENDHYQQRLKELFDELWYQPENIEGLYEHYQETGVFDLFKQGFDQDKIDNVATSNKSNFYVEEGEERTSKVKTRRRSQKLVQAARQHYSQISTDGHLYCEVCGFLEPDVVTRNIIQIHHLEPIAELNNGVEIPIEEAIEKVRPVCPTCHSIIHSRKPILSIDEAKGVRKWVNQKTAEL